MKAALTIVFNANREISPIGTSAANSGDILKPKTAKNSSETLCTKIRIREIGKSLTFLGANVCTLSEKQWERRIKLKHIIGEAQPEFIIFIETNLEKNWNPYPQIYDGFRTKNDKNCGVMILAKKDLFSHIIDSWENKGLYVFSKKLGIYVIGLYTPYYNDFEQGKKLLEKWSENKKWISFSDNEHMIKKICELW